MMNPNPFQQIKLKRSDIFTEKSLAEIANNINVGYNDSISERCAAITAGYGGQAMG